METERIAVVPPSFRGGVALSSAIPQPHGIVRLLQRECDSLSLDASKNRQVSCHGEVGPARLVLRRVAFARGPSPTRTAPTRFGERQ